MFVARKGDPIVCSNGHIGGHVERDISQSETLTYDGRDCAVTGGTAYDSLSLTKVNGSTVKSVLKKGGQVVGHATRTVSGKGKVLTVSTSLKTAMGGTVHDIAVFDKQ